MGTYPKTEYDLAERLQQLGIGEAIVTVLDPEGAPTPVAWTRMRAPQASMDPLDADAMATGVAGSAMQARYGTPLDRESAYEVLNARLQAGAEAAAAEEAARAGHVRQVEADAEAARAATRELRAGRPARREKSLLEHLTENTMVRQMARSAAREITRSIFGTGRRR